MERYGSGVSSVTSSLHLSDSSFQVTAVRDANEIVGRFEDGGSAVEADTSVMADEQFPIVLLVITVSV